MIITVESKICDKCGESKELSKFPKFVQRDGITVGRRNTCNACHYKRRQKKNVVEYIKQRVKPEQSENFFLEPDNQVGYEIQNRIEFTETEISKLKEFINSFDHVREQKSLHKKRSNKKNIALDLDVDILTMLEKKSLETSINISDIINAILIREFIHID